MSMNDAKSDFTNRLEKWLQDFLGKKYGGCSHINVIQPKTSLNRLTDINLKLNIPNISFLDFKPDILGILTHVKTNETELVFLNREVKAFGLREIGEMVCYCRLANPKIALMISSQGLASPIDKMINHNKRNDIISYNNRNIFIFRWDREKDEIDHLSITPIEGRKFISDQAY